MADLSHSSVQGRRDYVDLAKAILVVRAKVTKANGDDLDQDEKVGLVKNFVHSLFKQVDVFLKGRQVTQATGTMHIVPIWKRSSTMVQPQNGLNLPPQCSTKTRALKWIPLTQHSLETMLMSTLASRKGMSLAKKAVSSKWRDLYSATCLWVNDFF